MSASTAGLAEVNLGNDVDFEPAAEMPDIGDEQVDAALLAQTSFPHGTGIVETERSLPDHAESGSLAESTAWATKRECRLDFEPRLAHALQPGPTLGSDHSCLGRLP